MSITKSEIRAGAYYDSVVLMQLQRSLAALDGVEDAGVVMATPANLELLADFELLTQEGKTANPDDLLIVVRAGKAEAAEAALGQVDALLTARRSSISSEFRARSMAGAAKNLPDAEWVLISVPGRYAADVADEALDLDKHVFLYSDNVSVEDEIKLKAKGVEKGRMVMGPDCGTAIINGVGLGFANRVRRGPIGLVGASGTGLQAITSQIHNLGGGVSQAIGTGGRDLKEAVGGQTMLQGLDYLTGDEGTSVIVLVSKPPAAQVSTRLLQAARKTGKPVVVDFIGFAPPAPQIGNLYFAAGMEDAARLAVELAKKAPGSAPEVAKAHDGYLRGLFSGGTLASETLLGLQNFLSPLFSNVAHRDEQKMADPLRSQAHSILDLGEDVFTVGRLHPMMDNDLRIRRMKEEAEDPEVGMILLDVVLGEGAHADPASELAPVMQTLKKARKDLDFVVLVVGTDEDPQDSGAQVEAFEKAGAKVLREVNQVVAYVSAALGSESDAAAHPVKRFVEPLAAINVGVETFYESLKAQGAEAVQVDWRPPAGGNEDLMSILEKMRS
ncbi:MAG: acyl-CoA synthetase FdrA [Chloroflexi bacterium]|nr:acyl-CoA synthetase FdrA [Chloroflexota bacterium]MQC26713.1 acyl-CoA synthetase FdrA [Chloroflexota bacterium]